MEEKKIKGRKHVKLRCAHSGEYFWKDKSEYTRRISINPDYKFYKSLQDAALGAGEKGYLHLKPWAGKANDNLIRGGQRDEFSPFKYFIATAKKRSRAKKGKSCYESYNITLEYLKDLWETQDGKCAISGVKMELPPTLQASRYSPFCASLDRINSESGYTQGNVQFVTQFCNLGKRDFKEGQVLKFICAIRSAT